MARKRTGTHCERCGVVDLQNHHVFARFCMPCQAARPVLTFELPEAA
jgi:hypothetical protein